MLLLSLLAFDDAAEISFATTPRDVTSMVVAAKAESDVMPHIIMLSMSAVTQIIDTIFFILFSS